jgi:BirA family biotin operon repressor/biotin-[acetyl-CoA-carboxylase] ligase
MKDQLRVNDTLAVENIKEGLDTSCFGQEISYLSSTESTNLVARQLAQEGAREGTLVITDYQTQGRGRLKRSWWSPPGENLLFSLIFRPPFEATHTFRLTLISSLAVAEAIRQETGLEALIKWPNDIYLKGKKVSGILSELGVKGEQLQYVVVGIGINVNSDSSTYPEIKEIATSLSLELGKRFSRLKLLKAILELIERYYHVMQRGDFNSLKHTWDALSLIKGKKVKVVSKDEFKEGVAESIDEEGFLILRDYSGRKSRIVSADVSLSLV